MESNIREAIRFVVLVWLYADILFVIVAIIGGAKREKLSDGIRVYSLIMLLGPLNALSFGILLLEVRKDFDKNNGYLRNKLRKLETEREELNFN